MRAVESSVLLKRFRHEFVAAGSFVRLGGCLADAQRKSTTSLHGGHQATFHEFPKALDARKIGFMQIAYTALYKLEVGITGRKSILGAGGKVLRWLMKFLRSVVEVPDPEFVRWCLPRQVLPVGG